MSGKMNWELYCEHRISGLTQRQAYLAAYPNSKKWKPAVVDVQASKLEAEPKVNLRLQELKTKLAERGQIKAEAIVDKLKTIAFAEKNVARRGGIKFKGGDVLRALKLLGDYLGMWQTNVNVSGTIENPFQDLTTEELKKLASHE